MASGLIKRSYQILLLVIGVLSPLGEQCRAQSILRAAPMFLAQSAEADSSDTAPAKKKTPTKNYEGWTTKSGEDKRRQSPSNAMFKSLLVPGLGQIGNRKYLKAAIIIGGETFLFFRWLDFRNQTVEARAAFEAEEVTSLRGELFVEFDNVREKRNLSAWLTGTLIFASMIDAFVDAHLSEFPDPEKGISFEVEPTLFGNQPAAGFAARITWHF